MYYINHAQYVRIPDKARGLRARSARGPSALSGIRIVFGHDLCNLCHRKNAITLLFARPPLLRRANVRLETGTFPS